MCSKRKVAKRGSHLGLFLVTQTTSVDDRVEDLPDTGLLATVIIVETSSNILDFAEFGESGDGRSEIVNLVLLER